MRLSEKRLRQKEWRKFVKSTREMSSEEFANALAGKIKLKPPPPAADFWTMQWADYPE